MVAAVIWQAVPCNVFPVKQDFSFCRGVQPAQEGEQRRFARAGRPQNRIHHSRFKYGVHTGQNPVSLRIGIKAVSYTHLDVYKRQVLLEARGSNLYYRDHYSRIGARLHVEMCIRDSFPPD